MPNQSPPLAPPSDLAPVPPISDADLTRWGAQPLPGQHLPAPDPHTAASFVARIKAEVYARQLATARAERYQRLLDATDAERELYQEATRQAEGALAALIDDLRGVISDPHTKKSTRKAIKAVLRTHRQATTDPAPRPPAPEPDPRGLAHTPSADEPLTDAPLTDEELASIDAHVASDARATTRAAIWPHDYWRVRRLLDTTKDRTRALGGRLAFCEALLARSAERERAATARLRAVEQDRDRAHAQLEAVATTAPAAAGDRAPAPCPELPVTDPAVSDPIVVSRAHFTELSDEVTATRDALEGIDDPVIVCGPEFEAALDELDTARSTLAGFLATPGSDPAITTAAPVLVDVLLERNRQIERWGGPEGDGVENPTQPNGTRLRVLVEEVGEVAEAMGRPEDGNGIGDLRTELVQTAAVCVAWVEGLDAATDAPVQ